jgi:hypothetical protein
MAEVCSNPKIPKRLHRNNRLPNQTFEPKEILFERFKIRVPFHEWVNNNTVSASIFQFKREGDSFNRELYSLSPLDVLFNIEIDGGDLTDYGVMGFKCETVKNCAPYVDEMNNVFSMNIIHDPNPCMYPHTIIKVFKNGVNDASVKSRPANAEFRDELKSNLTLYKPADIT